MCDNHYQVTYRVLRTSIPAVGKKSRGVISGFPCPPLQVQRSNACDDLILCKKIFACESIKLSLITLMDFLPS